MRTLLTGLILLAATILPVSAQELTPEGYSYNVPHAPGVRAGNSPAETVADQTTTTPPATVIVTPRYGLFYPYFGYPTAPVQPYVSPYNASPYNNLGALGNNSANQQVPATTTPACNGANCAYQAVPTYGPCYNDPGGVPLHSLTGWECRRYDGTQVPLGNCQAPPQVASCN
jgi:hypothetical protein